MIQSLNTSISFNKYKTVIFLLLLLLDEGADKGGGLSADLLSGCKRARPLSRERYREFHSAALDSVGHYGMRQKCRRRSQERGGEYS